MNIAEIQHPTQNITVEAVTIASPDVLREVRASGWHEGQLAVLSYKTAAPVGYISPNNPKGLGGALVTVGDTILKGPGGDFEVVRQ